MKKSLFIDRPLLLRVLQQGLDFRGEIDAAIVNAVIERLDAHTVANQPQFSLPIVPKGNGEHATKLVEAFDSPFFKGVQNDLGVRVIGLPDVTAYGFQLFANFGVVVDLAVEHDLQPAVFVAHGLSSRIREVDDGQPSVHLRKVSDVPVGVFLSGGIDSSTNAALFSEGPSEHVKTFSIGYEGNYDSYQNELVFARRVAQGVGADYHEKLLTVDDLIGFLPEMVRLQDEPIADPVCFPVYFVSKLARDNGVSVCQVGEGADELFWGYPGWKTSLRLQQLSDLPIPRVFKRVGLAAMRTLKKELSFSYEWLRRGSEGKPIFWGGAEAFTETHKARLLSPRLRKKLGAISSWEAIAPIYGRFKEKAKAPSRLNWMTYLDLNLRLPELLLMRVDKMSMGVSLEGRVPFLDHKLVELAMGIPESVKTRNGTLKYILKKAVRGVIPDEIINRPKQGFGVPIHEWLLDKLGDEIRKELKEFCQSTDFFDSAEVFRLIEERKAAQVWYLFNFALWWKTYIKV